MRLRRILIILVACLGLVALTAGLSLVQSVQALNPAPNNAYQPVAQTAPTGLRPQTLGDNPVDPQTQILRDVYQQVNPSVVSIAVRVPSSVSGPSNTGIYDYAAGSGFVYDTAGHIVTNSHVIDSANRIEVTFSDDTTMYAKVVGSDPDSDVAVIQVQGDASKYKPLTLADSDAVVVGDLAIAIGNPFQQSGTMTHGIVSSLHRSVDALTQSGSTTGGNYTIPDAIQTDAPINPGNSGGPLLNSGGEVIGINEQIASTVRQSSGVSFAIPSNLVKIVADALIKDGKIDHSWLGIGGGTLSLDMKDALKLPLDLQGIYVSEVQPGSPADKGGLQAGTATVSVDGQRVPSGGDVIIAIDGQPTKHFDDLTSYLFTHTTVGQTVKLTVIRDGKQLELSVTLGARPHA
jgi:S1-C subfamily serine protease